MSVTSLWWAYRTLRIVLQSPLLCLLRLVLKFGVGRAFYGLWTLQIYLPDRSYHPLANALLIVSIIESWQLRLKCHRDVFRRTFVHCTIEDVLLFLFVWLTTRSKAYSVVPASTSMRLFVLIAAVLKWHCCILVRSRVGRWCILSVTSEPLDFRTRFAFFLLYSRWSFPPLERLIRIVAHCYFCSLLLFGVCANRCRNNVRQSQLRLWALCFSQ